MNHPGPLGEPAPEGQVYVCGACGKTAKTRYGMRDASCITWAVLCYEEKRGDAWVAVKPP